MKKFLLHFYCLIATVALQAQIRHVPAQYSTIQAGINAANPGDTVLVDDGTYYEKISLSGHVPILVGSQFIMDGNQSHISNTIIDGSQLPQSNNMSVVTFGFGNDSTTILCGFTVRGGKGKHFTGPFGDILVGGGIFISGGGAKICHNIITENNIDDGIYSGTQYFAGGAGIFTDYEDPSYWTVIEYNVITHNLVTGYHKCAYGGGIYVCNNTRVINNEIKFNQCWAGGTADDLEGGGIGCQSSQTPKQLILEGNQIDSNLVEVITEKISYGAGVSLFDMKAVIRNNQIRYNKGVVSSPPFQIFGGGIDFESISEGSLITGNTFEGNEATRNIPLSGYGSWGGALRLANPISDSLQLEISNNSFIGNIADWGGAIQSYGIHLYLFNNLFVGNQASWTGGAVHINWDAMTTSGHNVFFANNSFSHNYGKLGGAISTWNANPFILNCIFSNDSSETSSNEFLVGTDGGFLEIANSDLDTIPAGDAATGFIIRNNDLIFSDPLFLDPMTLETEHWSPCVDNGIQSYDCIHGETFDAPGFDILGNSRPVGLGYDMGAYDIEAWGVGIKRITNDDLRFTIYPDPFTSSTTFAYELKESCQGKLEIFDSFGRKVAEPINGQQLQGKQEVPWDASGLPAGIYFYRLEAGSDIGKGKIVKQ